MTTTETTKTVQDNTVTITTVTVIDKADYVADLQNQLDQQTHNKEINTQQGEAIDQLITSLQADIASLSS